MWNVGEYYITGLVDDDGHLNLFVTHGSGTPVGDTGCEIGDESEFGIRLTCEAVEDEYRNSIEGDN